MNRAERRQQERLSHKRNELTAEVQAKAAALGGRAADMRDYCFVLLVDNEGAASIPVFKVVPEQAVEWLRAMADHVEANPPAAPPPPEEGGQCPNPACHNGMVAVTPGHGPDGFDRCPVCSPEEGGQE